MRRPGPLVARLAAVVLVVSGCSGSDASTSSDSSRAWTRPTADAATNSVIYLIRPDRAVPITSARAPSSVVGSASIGAVVENHAAADGHIGHLDGSTEDPENATEVGEQIILHELVAPLAKGNSFTLTLMLGDGTTQDIEVQVATNQPSP